MISAFPPPAFNRPDLRGALLSALTPLIVVVVYNGLIFSTGLMTGDGAYEKVAFAPPGWVIGLVWCVIYPLWGLAHWRAAQAGVSGLPARFWILAMMGWGLAYPLLTGPTGIEISVAANGVALVLVAASILTAKRVSILATGLLALTSMWILFANFLGICALRSA